MEDGPIILLMDEDPAFAASVGDVLRGLGCRVEWAADGAAGLERAAAINPDVVIVEMLLPGRSGFRVAEELKRRDPTLPIIMCATFGSMAQRRLAEFLKIDEFLTKPVSPNRVQECVRRLSPAGLNPPHTRPTPQRATDVVPDN